MSLTRKQQQALFESINVSINPVVENVEPTTQVELSEQQMNDIETVVWDYISNAVGNDINESTSEEDRNAMIVEAVENLNNLCYIVNSYFGYNGWFTLITTKR